MKKFLLPLLMALIGVGGGIGGGLALRAPAGEADAMADPCGEAAAGTAEADHAEGADTGGHDSAAGEEGAPSHDYVKLNNQFIVPIVKGADVAGLVLMSINLEVAVGGTEKVYAQEPKLRDTFLQVLFDHANAGGFDGAFTASNTMDVLRHSLLEAAQTVLGPDGVSDVLIIDIVRQDT
jgi:flagellar protein FliL